MKNNTYKLLLSLLASFYCLAAFSLESLDEEEMAAVSGEGVGLILEDFQLTSPTPATDSQGKLYHYSTQSGATAGNIVTPSQGLNYEQRSTATSGLRFSDIEIGVDFFERAASGTTDNKMRIGSAYWNDPLRISFEDIEASGLIPDSSNPDKTAIVIRLPGRLSYSTSGDIQPEFELRGYDMLPINDSSRNFGYGFDRVGGGSGVSGFQGYDAIGKDFRHPFGYRAYEDGNPDNVDNYTAQGRAAPPMTRHDDSGFWDKSLDPGMLDAVGSGSTANGGEAAYTDTSLVYRLPSEMFRADQDGDGIGDLFIEGSTFVTRNATDPNASTFTIAGNNYTVAELSPAMNINFQANINVDASAVSNYSWRGSGSAPITTAATDGYHRLGTLRVSGIQFGRSNLPGRDVNKIILKAGAYQPKLDLPYMNCFSQAYLDSNLHTNGSGTQTNDFGDTLVAGQSTFSAAGSGCISGASGSLTAGKVSTDAADGAPINQSEANPGTGAFFNAYPEGWNSVKLDGSGAPVVKDGIRGAIEIAHLRIDDIRFAHSKDLDGPNWTRSPQDLIALENTNVGCAGGVTGSAPTSTLCEDGIGIDAYQDREFWITDLEIRDLYIGDMSIGADGNEIQPLSISFYNSPNEGRVLHVFLPFNANAPDQGRVSFYTPFIGPQAGEARSGALGNVGTQRGTDNGGLQTGYCCGSSIIDGIQIQYLDYKLYLD